jgi:hypothetical protein
MVLTNLARLRTTHFERTKYSETHCSAAADPLMEGSLQLLTMEGSLFLSPLMSSLTG